MNPNRKKKKSTKKKNVRQRKMATDTNENKENTG